MPIQYVCYRNQIPDQTCVNTFTRTRASEIYCSKYCAGRCNSTDPTTWAGGVEEAAKEKALWDEMERRNAANKRGGRRSSSRYEDDGNNEFVPPMRLPAVMPAPLIAEPVNSAADDDLFVELDDTAYVNPDAPNTPAANAAEGVVGDAQVVAGVGAVSPTALNVAALCIVAGRLVADGYIVWERKMSTRSYDLVAEHPNHPGEQLRVAVRAGRHDAAGYAQFIHKPPPRATHYGVWLYDTNQILLVPVRLNRRRK